MLVIPPTGPVDSQSKPSAASMNVATTPTSAENSENIQYSMRRDRPRTSKYRRSGSSIHSVTIPLLKRGKVSQPGRYNAIVQLVGARRR